MDKELIRDKSVLGIISARGGSKGVPKKNIYEVDGKPLLQWTIDAARKSHYIDRLILSSDDRDIIEAAIRGGCEVPYYRSPELSSDDATSISVVEDALHRIPGYDIVVLLQPTSPLRLAEDIDGSIEKLLDQDAPACVSLRPAADHPYYVFGLSSDCKLLQYAKSSFDYPTRRQDLPLAWCLNGAVYTARVDWFLLNRTFISSQTIGYPMPLERSLDIDTIEDIEQFKLIVQSQSPLIEY